MLYFCDLKNVILRYQSIIVDGNQPALVFCFVLGRGGEPRESLYLGNIVYV